MGYFTACLCHLPQSCRIKGQPPLASVINVDADLLASHVMGPWAASVEGSFFRTDGYKIVREALRYRIQKHRLVRRPVVS